MKKILTTATDAAGDDLLERFGIVNKKTAGTTVTVTTSSSSATSATSDSEATKYNSAV